MKSVFKYGFVKFIRFSVFAFVLMISVFAQAQSSKVDSSRIKFSEKPSEKWQKLFEFDTDSQLECPCFTEQMLDSLLRFTWKKGWWSDVPGCKLPPHHEMLEVYIVNMGLPEHDLNFTAQAGMIDGIPFVSSDLYNNRTKQFEWKCNGFPKDSIAKPCTIILSNFIKKLSKRFPHMDFCGNASDLSDNRLDIYTPPSVWKTPGYMIAFGVLLASLVYLIILLYLRRKYEAEKMKLKDREMHLEKAQLLLDERRRFAMELHDDVGTELTTIVYLSQIAVANTDEASKTEQVRKIGDQCRNLVQKMSEIIWALNAENDTTDRIAAYLRKMAAELFAEHEIAFASVTGNIEVKSIISVYRRNILLIVKEILHNIIKYSDTKRVEMEFDTVDGMFTIVIREIEGKGFDPEKVEKGNGLSNIEKRAKSSGIKYKFIRNENGMMTILQI